MSEPRIASYGAWSSPISASMLATNEIRIGQTWLEDGVAYWSEGRPAEGGRGVVVSGDPYSSPVDLVPADFNVRTTVHEYGGGAFAVQGGVLYCSRFEDQRLYRVEPGADPVAITPETGGAHRFADGRITADGSLWIGVRERHEGTRIPDDVHNELVVLPTDGSAEPRMLASGRSFYAAPRLSPDGGQLSFLAWIFPWMPWDGCELWVADLATDGSLGPSRLVAGRDGEESIWQPTWSPDGDLAWASDRSGWWNLERERGGERQALRPAEAEFGWPGWVFGSSSFAFLADGRIACHYGAQGVQHTAVLDPESGELIGSRPPAHGGRLPTDGGRGLPDPLRCRWALDPRPGRDAGLHEPVGRGAVLER